MVQANQAKQAAKGFRNEKERKEWEIQQLEQNRQSIPNPYENIKDVSYMVSNPFANLGVATQAAEMQAEEADISLANTLDALKQTGASAGGATALAQAALQSKKEVSANIEQQEAANEKLKAQGQAELERIKMAEAQRVQAAQAEGVKFQYGEQEARDIAKLNRLAGQSAQAANNQARANEAQSAAYGSIFSGVGSIAGSVLGSGLVGGGK